MFAGPVSSISGIGVGDAAKAVGTGVCVGTIVIVGEGEAVMLGALVGSAVGEAATVVGVGVGDVRGGETDGSVNWLPCAYTVNGLVMTLSMPFSSLVRMVIVCFPGSSGVSGRNSQFPEEFEVTEVFISCSD